MSRLGLVGAAAAAALILGLLGGCGTPLSQEAAELVEDSPPSAGDVSVQAYEAALGTISEPVPDAVLISAGSQGVALSDTPSQWSYLFLSPSSSRMWRVMVDHGKAGEPEEMGVSNTKLGTDEAMDPAAIKVGAARAISLAREEAAKTGEVPPNVMVTGFFVPSPKDAPVDLAPGVWTVTFIQGTSTEGSRAFDVDMMSGAVKARTGD